MTVLTPNSGVDVVGVFDANFNQLFPNARAMKGRVKEGAKVMDHPVESGSTITDHRIIMPVEIDLDVMLSGADYRDTYARVREVFLGNDTVTVQTRTGSYANMLVAEMPHDEFADVADAIPMLIRLREVIFVTAQFQALPPAKVAKKSDASTVKRGQQTGKDEATPRKSSVLYDVFYGKGK